MWKMWLFLVEAIAIVTTNIITIVTLTRNRRLRIRKYYLIVNLAVVDLLVGMLAVPLYFFTINGSTAKTYLAFRIVDPFLGIASLLGLAAIAIERAFATCFPFKHRAISKTPYIIGITVVWLTAFLFTVFILTLGFVESGMVILTSISVPLVIIICAYILIWVKYSCSRKILGRAIHQKDRRLSVTLAIVTFFSLITWVPFMAYSMYLTFCYIYKCELINYSLSLNITHMFKLLHYGNSFVNFVVYSLRIRNFRTEMARMFGLVKIHAAIPVVRSNVATVHGMRTNQEINHSNNPNEPSGLVGTNDIQLRTL